MGGVRRCRAKNPGACRARNCPGRGGASGVHVVGSGGSSGVKSGGSVRGVRESLGVLGGVSREGRVVLKDLGVGGLCREVVGLVGVGDVVGRERLGDSVGWAVVLHEGSVRKNPIRREDGSYHDESPYVTHPLRNTLRLGLLGERDVDVLVASVLHDTVEDEPERICGVGEGVLGDVELRERALGVVGERFGERVRFLVGSVSNPLLDRWTPREVRNRVYAEHVDGAVHADVGTFLVKVSDFVDNALSLHHNTDKSRNGRMAEKYLGVVPVLQSAFRKHEGELRGRLSVEGFAALEGKLGKASEYLRGQVERYG